MIFVIKRLISKINFMLVPPNAQCKTLLTLSCRTKSTDKLFLLKVLILLNHINAIFGEHIVPTGGTAVQSSAGAPAGAPAGRLQGRLQGRHHV